MRPCVLEVDLVVAAGVRTKGTGSCGFSTAECSFNLEDSFLFFFKAVAGGAPAPYLCFSRSFRFLVRAAASLLAVLLAPVRMESTEKE